MTRERRPPRYHDPMKRLAWICGFAALLTLVPSDGPRAADVQVAQQGLLQCMTQCLKHEGEDAYDTCKVRCANVPTGVPQDHDCMGDFKQCKKACDGNKACKKECKAALMTCG